ncbi:hypothetical protein PoB_004595800 [Plakobranchus ocellatus]|uniref:Uncharacterized protein n=1 Tax=Plakobranchus ocellatus TaxID=259542 RepID=A0AAV4BKV9_9GAST|nr:hypothetical protein PoB_004595800 [Plakobranchus ocellatus]
MDQSVIHHPLENLTQAVRERNRPIVGRIRRIGFLYTASPQQSDLRLSGPPSGQGAGGGARTRDRMVPADLRADSLATVPPTPLD